MEPCDDILKQIKVKAEAICAREEQCDYDVQQKIIKWGASREQLDSILDYLHENNYLNNERYAKAYARGKHHQLRWGRVKIAYQLKMKRIEDKNIESGLQEIDEDEYQENLRKIAEKKWGQIVGVDKYEREKKLIVFLQGRGYEMNEICKVVKKCK